MHLEPLNFEAGNPRLPKNLFGRQAKFETILNDQNVKLRNCLAMLKSLPTSLCQREETGVSPFEKGGLRGILQ